MKNTAALPPMEPYLQQALTPLPQCIWCLLWRYGDNSSFGVLRVYSKKARAEADLNLLSEADSGRLWEIVELPLNHE